MPVADNKYTFQIIGEDKTLKTFQQIAKSTRSLVNKVGKFAVGVGGGLLVVTQQSIAANTEMTRLGHSVGVSSQAMSEWAHAGKSVNIEGKKMADIFKDVSDKIGDVATTGGGQARDLFEKMNLDLKEMVKLSPDQQLLKIGAALDDVSSRTEKVFFLETLANDATRLLPLLENNAEGLRLMQLEARALGVSLDEVSAAKLQGAQESIERVTALSKGLGNQVAIKLAPIVEVLADSFVELIEDAGGAGAVIQKGFDVGIKLAGWLADGVHAIKIAFKGLEVVARLVNAGLATGLVHLVSGFADLGNAIIDGVIFPFRKSLELLAPFSDGAAAALTKVNDLVEAIKIKAPEGLQVFADAQLEAFGAAKSELEKLLQSNLPSEAIRANVKKILDEADALAKSKAAEIIARNQRDQGDGVNTENITDAIKQERARLAARVALIAEYDELELLQLQEKMLSEQQIVQEARDKKAIDEELYRQKLLDIEVDFERKKRALKAKEFQAEATLTASFLSNIVQAFAGSGKKSFELQKKIALAKALVTLPSAVIQSYENAGGYPLGIPAALAMAAAGLAEIRNIKDTSFGGGGGGGSSAAGGGGGAPGGNSPDLSSLGIPNSVNRQEVPERNIVINIQGDLHSNHAETMVDDIYRLLSETDKALIPTDSRNAIDLRGEG